VKEALLDTIQEVLDSSNSEKILQAWDFALELVVETMQSYEV
jgi:hemoglobin-like flavoprotein